MLYDGITIVYRKRKIKVFITDQVQTRLTMITPYISNWHQVWYTPLIAAAVDALDHVLQSALNNARLVVHTI